MKDYYYILGINKGASTDEIKTAYRKLSQKFHPDKNEDDVFFADRFKEILEAYETLSNNSQRIKYDSNFLYNGQASKTNSGYNFEPIIDYFKANKLTFEYDEEITFSWKTINSDKVTIKPFGNVQAIGQKTYKIKDFKSPILHFELIAENSNIGRQTKQILSLKNKTFHELYMYFSQLIENKEKKKEKRSNNQTNNSKSEDEIRSTVEFSTDRGKIKIELNFRGAVPALKNKVYQNNTLAEDGKYKLGFMYYLTIRGGIIDDITLY